MGVFLRSSSGVYATRNAMVRESSDAGAVVQGRSRFRFIRDGSERRREERTGNDLSVPLLTSGFKTRQTTAPRRCQSVVHPQQASSA